MGNYYVGVVESIALCLQHKGALGQEKALEEAVDKNSKQGMRKQNKKVVAPILFEVQNFVTIGIPCKAISY